MNINFVRKEIQKKAKRYKYQIFDWGLFLFASREKAEKALKVPGNMVWDDLRTLAKNHAGWRKILYFIATLGESSDDTQQKAQGLLPYEKDELHILLFRMAERMEQAPLSPFWECVGFSPQKAMEEFKLIRSRWALHPLNAAKAYAAIIKDASSWQELLNRTFYVAQIDRELKLKVGDNKILSSFQTRGVVKI